MFVKKIKYTDYNGVERDEDFYFNLSKAELAEMELMESGGLKGMLERIIQTHDQPKLVQIFKEIILKSYGEKSNDGKRFVKSQEIRDAFEQTEAYSELFMELLTDSDKAVQFIKSIVPSDLGENVDAENKVVPMTTQA